jgi:predicted transposase YdaD
LRNLELKLKTAMDSIAEYISEERDVLYLRGLDKGEEKIIASLLTKLNYSIDQIADIAGVSVELVKSVQQKLSAEK